MARLPCLCRERSLDPPHWPPPPPPIALPQERLHEQPWASADPRRDRAWASRWVAPVRHYVAALPPSRVRLPGGGGDEGRADCASRRRGLVAAPLRPPA